MILLPFYKRRQLQLTGVVYSSVERLVLSVELTHATLANSTLNIQNS
jgi:hypothetical protein